MHSFCKIGNLFEIRRWFYKKDLFLSNISRSCPFFTYFLVPLHRILRNTYIFMTRKTKLHEIRDYVIIALAMIEGSIGLNIFLLPNHITMGGVGGIASILIGDLASRHLYLIWRSMCSCFSSHSAFWAISSV